MDTAVQIFLWLFGGAGLIVVGWLIDRWRKSRSKPKQIQSPALADLKRQARLLVVDDQPFEYLRQLKQNGFRVTTSADLTSTKEVEAGEYDVVLLDLQGIGSSLSDEQGVGVLRQVKESSPAQVVIAYSSASWPLAASKQVALADSVLDKATATYPDFRQAIEVHLLKSATFDYYVDRLIDLAPDADRSKVIESLIWLISSPADRQRAEDLQEALGINTPGHPRLPQAQAVAALAVRRLTPWIV